MPSPRNSKRPSERPGWEVRHTAGPPAGPPLPQHGWKAPGRAFTFVGTPLQLESQAQPPAVGECFQRHRVQRTWPLCTVSQATAGGYPQDKPAREENMHEREEADPEKVCAAPRAARAARTAVVVGLCGRSVLSETSGKRKTQAQDLGMADPGAGDWGEGRARRRVWTFHH